MGISILELVLRRLREENFTADVAYPGQKYPVISEPVAAVHIEKVDRANLTVTVEINIICPAEMGGAACELEALRATEVLRWAGAVCVQNGCSYEGVAQVYMVSVLATFTCVTEAEDCTLGPGFKVYVNDYAMPHAVRFTAEETAEHTPYYAMGENAPVDSIPGSTLWTIRLEEMIPTGNVVAAENQGWFHLRFETDAGKEKFYRCRWTSVLREYTKEGLRRVRTGFSALREVVTDG